MHFSWLLVEFSANIQQDLLLSWGSAEPRKPHYFVDPSESLATLTLTAHFQGGLLRAIRNNFTFR